MKGLQLKNLLLALALTVSATLITACGSSGGGGTSAGVTPPTGGGSTSTQATKTLSFTIPVSTASSTTVKTPTSIKRTATSSRKPLYVSPDTAAFSLSIDGNLVFNKAAASTASSSGQISIPNETGTASYTVTSTPAPAQGNNGNSSYITVTATLDVLPGQHSVGVVLQAADGFVLSEDQETYTLAGGSNPNATLYLKGVVDSAFWCDAACDGQAGTPDANGLYTLQVFATDHEGDAIPYQLNGSTPIALDNGPVTMVETDTNNVVTIGNAGPFTNPGNAFTVSYQEGGQTILEGYSVTLKCNTMGSTTVALQVGPESAGGVTGFNYAAPIDLSKDPTGDAYYNSVPTPQTNVYTTPNLQVGPIPVQQDFGNKLTINCDASLGLTIL